MSEKKSGLNPGALLRDVGKALGIGVAVAAGLGLVLFLIGLAANGGSSLMGLEVAKDGLFLCVAVLLFFLAGMMLMKGKKSDELKDKAGWRSHFAVLGHKSVVGLLALGFILVSSLVDYLMLL